MKVIHMHKIHKKDNYCTLAHWPLGIHLIDTRVLRKTWLISQMPSDEDNLRIGSVWKHLFSGIMTGVFILKGIEIILPNRDLGL